MRAITLPVIGISWLAVAASAAQSGPWEATLAWAFIVTTGLLSVSRKEPASARAGAAYPSR